MAQVDLRHATISLVPGTGPAFVMKIGAGNLTYSQSRPIEYLADRGILDEVRLDTPAPLEVSLDAVWISVGTDVILHSSATPSVASTLAYDQDYLMKTLRGTLTWDHDADGGTTPEILITSSDPDTTRPFAVDIVIEYATTGATPNTKIVLPDFRFESADYDLDAGTISLGGKCFALKPTITEIA